MSSDKSLAFFLSYDLLFDSHGDWLWENIYLGKTYIFPSPSILKFKIASTIFGLQKVFFFFWNNSTISFDTFEGNAELLIHGNVMGASLKNCLFYEVF